MEATGVLDGAPARRVGGHQYRSRFRKLVDGRNHSANDMSDLIRVNAPHSQEPEVVTSSIRIVVGLCGAPHINGNVVVSHLVVAERRGGDLRFRHGYDGVIKLAGGVHPRGGNRAPEVRDKIHQTEVKGLNEMVGGELVNGVEGLGGFDK